MGVYRWNIPYVFATNHGGTPEAEKGAILAEQLKLPIATEQMLLAHTPMKQLVSKYQDKLVLVMGQTKQLTDTIMKAYVPHCVKESKWTQFLQQQPVLTP